MADIQFILIVGERVVSDNGDVDWENAKHETSLVTFFDSAKSAKEEAKRLFGERLDRILADSGKY